MSIKGRYVTVSFLTWLPTGLYLPSMVLLMLDRGLSLPVVAAVGLAYSITVSLLELPTGGLADALGRRPVLIAAALTSLAGLVMLGLGTTVAVFAISSVLRGVARALGTGPAEAWYVDSTLQAHGKDADLTAGLAAGNMAGSVALTIGTLAGGLIPLGLAGRVPSALAIPILIAAGVEVVRLVVTIVTLPEPRHARPRIGAVLRQVPLNISEGLKLGLRDGVIARLLLISGAVGLSLATIELLTPAWFAEVTGRFESAGVAYAMVAAAGFAASAIGAGLSARVVLWTRGPAQAGLAGLTVMAPALGGLAAATLLSGLTAIVVAGLAYCVIFIGLGIAQPPMSTVLHGRVGSAQRATTISMQSLSLQLVGAIGPIGLAVLATSVGAGAAFGAAAIVLGASGLLLRRVRKEGATGPLSLSRRPTSSDVAAARK